MKISKKYELPIIEDSAEAIGSVYKNKKAGSMGKFGTFSFHGTKTITTGEGGMFACKSKKVWDNYQLIHNMGKNPKQPKYFFLEGVPLIHSLFFPILSINKKVFKLIFVCYCFWYANKH